MSWSCEHISGETYYLHCSRQIVQLGRTESRTQTDDCCCQGIDSIGFDFWTYAQSVFYPLECADARAGVKLCGLTGLERGQVFHMVLMETSAFVTWRVWCSVRWCRLQSSWSRCPDSRTGQLWGLVSQRHTKWVKHSRQKEIQPWNNSCLLQFLAYV